jgi:UPF0755 protein
MRREHPSPPSSASTRPATRPGLVPPARRPGPRRGLLGRALLFAGLVCALLATLGWVGLAWRPDGGPEARRDLVIPQGASRDAILDALERAGLAPFPPLTWLAFRVTGAFGRVRAGAWRVPANASTLELLDLLDGRAERAGGGLRLIPGHSLWAHEAAFVDHGLAREGELLALANDPDFMRDLGVPLDDTPPPHAVAPPDRERAPLTRLEGYLWPDTWQLDPGTSLRVAVRLTVEAFHRNFKELEDIHGDTLARVREELGLTDHQLVTLASLVEKEVVEPTEAPLIAGVFYNRLRQGWRLETDPTLMYREDRVGRAPSPTERRDKTNPYNTYAWKGLPPGPIASPGRVALAAVMAPAATEDLFFVARRDGSGRHAFAKDLKAHEANIDRFLRGGASQP